MINEQAAPTGRSAGSLAWAGLFNTFFWIDPSTMGGVFMAQVLPFVDPKTLQAFYDFEAAYYGRGVGVTPADRVHRAPGLTLRG